jgi:hypothetical protein
VEKAGNEKKLWQIGKWLIWLFFSHNFESNSCKNDSLFLRLSAIKIFVRLYLTKEIPLLSISMYIHRKTFAIIIKLIVCTFDAILKMLLKSSSGVSICPCILVSYICLLYLSVLVRGTRWVREKIVQVAQLIWVLIPPGFKVLRKNIAMLLCVLYLLCVVCVFNK